MKTISYVWLILCSVLICSYQTMSDNVIDVQSNGKTLSQKQYFEAPQYVMLENSDKESLISRVNKVLLLKDRVAVADVIGNKLVLFDSGGKYIASTARMIGKGKNEYIHFLDCSVDMEKQLIYMYCDRPYQFMVFDSDLNLLECIKTDDFITEFTLDKEYLYAYCVKEDGTSYELRRYDRSDISGKHKVLLAYDKGVGGLTGSGHVLCGSDDHIYFSMPFNNEIYKIKNGTIQSSMTLNFNGKWFSYDESKRLSRKRFLEKNKEQNWIIQNIHPTGSGLLFNTNKAPFFKLNEAERDGDSYRYFDDTYFPYGSSWIIPYCGEAKQIVQEIPMSSIREYVKVCREKKGTMIPEIERFADNGNEGVVLQILKSK